LLNKVTIINSAVDEIIKQKNHKKTLVYYWGAAAVLLISFGLFWINYVNLNPQLAQLEGKKLVILPPIVSNTDSIYDYTAPKAKNKSIELAFNKVPKEPIEINKELAVDVEKLTEKINIDAEEPSISRLDNTSNDQVLNVLSTPESKQKEQVEITSKFKKKLSLPAAVSNDNLNNNAYNNLNDSIFTEVTFKTENNSDSSNYIMAKNEYRIGNFKNSLNLLDIIVNNSKSMYYESSLFLAAQVYAKQNNINKAKTTLKKVIKLKGVKQVEAEQLLNSLK
jgi:hypothetical protein